MRDHIVYILGAGFSTLGGMPVVSNFFQYMLAALEWCGENGLADESAAIKEIIDSRLASIGAGYRTTIDLDNIEQLFSYLTIKDAASKEMMPRAIAGTLEYARQNTLSDPSLYFRTITKRDSFEENEALNEYRSHQGNTLEIPDVEFLIAQLVGSNCLYGLEATTGIITFNYDTLVEEALTELRVPYTYGLGKSTNKATSTSYAELGVDSVPVLKIHGSVNWAASPKTGIGVFNKYGDLRAAGKEPLITPPIWNKDTTGSVRKCWERAIEELKKATHIVILGYSFPSTDIHTRFLVAAGLQSNVTLRHVMIVDNNADRVKDDLSHFIVGSRLAKRDIIACNCDMRRLAYSAREILYDVSIDPRRNSGWDLDR